jgi:hypothetical protein
MINISSYLFHLNVYKRIVVLLSISVFFLLRKHSADNEKKRMKTQKKNKLSALSRTKNASQTVRTDLIEIIKNMNRLN